MDSNVTKFQVKEELHRQWGSKAVDLALKGNWDEAVQLNLRILENYPSDIQSRNRLGKAYYELGRYEESLQIYEECLKVQPSNNIARKRLAELYAMLKREPTFALGETMPGIEIAEGNEDELEDLENYFEEDETDAGTDDEGDSE
jgi:tetratricopeptide (TPR) repeat protein